MYWTDWGNPGKIERASMDGTARETLHDTALIWPNDITIDYQSQTIYWMDASLDKLESSHVNGSNRRVISRELIVHPFSLTFYNGIIYWSDWGYKRVIFASLSNVTAVFGIVPTLSNDPSGVKVVSLDAQPISELLFSQVIYSRIISYFGVWKKVEQFTKKSPLLWAAVKAL